MGMNAALTWNGDQVERRVRKGGQAGVNKALERLRGLAVERAPLRDGPLRGSAFVDPAGGDAMGGRVGFDTVYAARQHEERDWAHTQGQAGYLGDTVEEFATELGQIIAAGVRRAF